MENSEIDIRQLDLLSPGDVMNYLDVSATTFQRLVKFYDIPYRETSACKIFLKSDVVAFQEKRKHKLIHRKKKFR